MSQYCRYCNNFVTGNGNYCEVLEFEPSDKYAKRTNHCKHFDLNPIDAYAINEKGYRPRPEKKNDGKQLRMEDFL